METNPEKSCQSCLCSSSVVRFALAFNRGAQSVPGEAGAFDAGGEFADAGEDFQAAQVVLFGFGVEVAFDHSVEFVEHHFRLLPWSCL